MSARKLCFFTPTVPAFLPPQAFVLILVAIVVILVAVTCYGRRKMTVKRLAREMLEGHLIAVAHSEVGWSSQVRTRGRTNRSIMRMN